MPKSHRAHLEWTPSRLIHWAEGVGTATAELVRTILERKPHPEMGYRALSGGSESGEALHQATLEAASQRAVQLQACSYQSVKSILKRSLDRQLVLDPERGVRRLPARFWWTCVEDEFRLVSLAEALSVAVPVTDCRVIL